MRTKYLPTIILAILLVMIPTAALALEGEYYVYNAFEPVTAAFRKIALIVSDSGYKQLFGIAIALSIFAGGATNFFRALATGKSNLLSWAMPLLAGVAVYAGFFASTGTLHVYDPVQNRTETVAGIPNGIVMFAMTLNSIERGVVEIIYTSGAIGDYQREAGGISFDLFSRTAEMPVASPAGSQSVARYVADCVLFEINRPGSTLTTGALTNPASGSNILDLMAEAKNPAVYTVTWLGELETPGAGDTTSCSDAYDRIKIEYDTNASTTMANAAKNLCGEAGYGTDASAAPSADGSTSIASCKSAASDLMSAMTGSSMPFEGFLAQREISQAFYQTLKTSDPISSTMFQSNKQMTSGIAAGFAVASQIPIMKGVFTAIILTLTPLLIIFIPTTACIRALSLIAGFFVLLTSWGICDAVIHGAMMDYAVKYFAQISQSGQGLLYFLTFPDNATATMAMFGSMRGMGLGLASLVTFQLVKFGGVQLSQMVTGIQAGAQTNAMKAADTQTSIESKGSHLNSMLQGFQGMSNAERFDTRSQYAAATMTGAAPTATALRKIDAFQSIDAALDAEAKNGTFSLQSGVANADAATKLAGAQNIPVQNLLEKNADLDLTQKTAHTDEIQKQADAKGTTPGAIVSDLENVATTGKVAESAALDKAAAGMGISREDFQHLDAAVRTGDAAAKANAFQTLSAKTGVPVADLQKGLAAYSTGNQVGQMQERGKATGGDVAEAGIQEGQTRATAETGKVQGIGLAGGLDSYRQLIRDDYSGRQSRNALLHQAANQMVDQIAPELKKDPAMWKDGALTERGFFEMQKAVEASGGVKFSTADGSAAVNLDKNGDIINAKNEGVIAKGDRAAAEQLQADLRRDGFENAAAWVGKREGQQMSYNVERDRNGHISSFSVNQGGQALRSDMRKSADGSLTEHTNFTQTKTGHSNQKIDEDVNTVNKGNRVTKGDITWTGVKKVDEHTHFSTNQDLAQVNRVLTDKDGKYINQINHHLEAIGSEQRVQAGDHLNLVTDHSGNIASWTIQRGGSTAERDAIDITTGKTTTVNRNVENFYQGTNTTGAATAMVKDVAGSEAAQYASTFDELFKGAMGYAKIGAGIKGKAPAQAPAPSPAPAPAAGGVHTGARFHP